MYAVIASGGKQERVEVGSRVNLELTGSAVGDEIGLSPVLVVDGDRVLAAPTDLEGTEVRARVLAEAKGPKIIGFTYKAKARARRRFGHRQRYHTVEITAIAPSKG